MRRSPALLLVAAASLLASCATLQGVFQKPKVSFDRADLVAASFEDLKVNLHFKVYNPNSIGVKLDGYAMRFAVDGLTLVDGVVDQALDLRGGASTSFVIPTTLKWAEVAAKIAGGFSKDALPYDVGGDVRFNTPIGQLKVPFSHQGDLPVIKPPTVYPSGLRLGKASLTSVSVDLDVAVENPMARAIGLLDFGQQVTLGGRTVATSTLTEPLKVEAKGRSVRTVRLSLSPAEVGMSVIQALVGKSAVEVGVSGGTKVDTGLGTIPWSFQKTASLKPR